MAAHTSGRLGIRLGPTWIIAAAAAVCLIATPAHAQTSTSPTPATPASTSSDTKASHWGVVFSATPSWYLPSSITDNIAKDGGGVALVGSQLTIGIVRGRAMSGDW